MNNDLTRLNFLLIDTNIFVSKRIGRVNIQEDPGHRYDWIELASKLNFF